MGFNAYSAKADKQASISYQDRSVEK
jgi:hypothetical protein